MKYIPKKQKGSTLYPWDSLIKTENQVVNFVAPEIIKHYEKFKPKVYQNKGDVPTIGYGSTEKKYVDKKVITKPEAHNAVIEYISKNINPILQKQPYYSKLNAPQKVALTSLIYNIGATKFLKQSPNLQKSLKLGDWNSAALNMNHGATDPRNGGLKSRREFEQKLFLNKFWSGGLISIFKTK